MVSLGMDNRLLVILG